VHRQFRPVDTRRGHLELQRQTDVYGPQRWESSYWNGPARSSRQLEQVHLPVNGLRSKSWEEFSAPGAPKLDFVFTVCDNAANEVCPVWPGQPMTAHWGIPDPAAVRGNESDIQRAFREAYFLLDRRISLFLSLPFKALDNLALKRELDDIGKSVSPVEQGR